MKQRGLLLDPKKEPSHFACHILQGNPLHPKAVDNARLSNMKVALAIVRQANGWYRSMCCVEALNWTGLAFLQEKVVWQNDWQTVLANKK